MNICRWSYMFYMSFQHTFFNSGNYKLLHKKIVSNAMINVLRETR